MPSEVRLTRAQKWDLVRMSGAAVVSTVFFAIPMFLAHPNGAPPEARPAIQLASMTPDASAVRNLAPLPASTLDTVTVVTSTEMAAVSTPVLQPPGAAPRRRATGGTIQARQRGNGLAPAPFGRRLARLIAGSGRYGVRPFPSVNTSGS
jgi:hypothetical protein